MLENQDRDELLVRAVRTHQADLWRYLRYLGADGATASDITQDAFVELYTGPMQELSDASTAAWLRTVARHKFLRTQRRLGRELSMDWLNAREQTWVELTPVRSDERLAALEDCLKQLGDRDRRAVELKYTRVLTEGEVAEELQISESASKSLLQRIRKKLRNCVERKVSDA